MVLVAERYRLGPDHARVCDVGRPLQLNTRP
jgi:hypothetical protein